jgi:hypothetical protein
MTPCSRVSIRRWNYDTSVYQNIAVQMAQEPPLSKSFSVQNSAADPLILPQKIIPSVTRVFSKSATTKLFALLPEIGLRLLIFAPNGI